MHIFVTGVAGFLGSHIAERFLADGHEVSGVDNLIGGYRDNVPAGVNFWQRDLADLGELNFALEGERKVDVIYHAACTPYEGLSVFSPSLVCQNTYQISVNVMSAAIKNSVKRVVMCSSMARYGRGNEYFHPPFHEEQPLFPQDPYGIAKVAAEQTMTCLARAHGVELVIAVPHNIVGPRQKYDDPYRNVASIFVNRMLQGKQPIVYGDGKQVRCLSDVDDVLQALTQVATHPHAAGHVFNIGPDDHPAQIIEIAEMIAGKLNFKFDPIFMDDRPCEVKHATCSSAKIRDWFGYQTKHTLSDALDRLIGYIQTRGALPFTYHLPIEFVTDKTPRTWSERLM